MECLQKWLKTMQRTAGPWTSTSLTPDARSTCRAGVGPTNVTSTRCVVGFSAMTSRLGGSLPQHIR